MNADCLVCAPLPDTVLVGPFSIVESGQIGEHTIIGAYTQVLRNTVVGAHCLLEGCVLESSRIGDNTKVYRNTHVMKAVIGRDCLIGANCFIADSAVIGDNVRMMLNCGIGRLVTIEDDVRIGPNVVFANANPGDGQLTPCVIGKGAWIGTNVCTTPGVSIGAGAVVGAGSVVTRDVPPGVTVVGNPAKAIRK